ncbi:selenium cofactor biosynthesis protein YqeC [Collinsella sp. HCP28S3_G12]|uniref:selenium cofactor biosynthesis protein YqeC n=1 Tax=Collinsella sp. HCP28S3_G12 TaxID=3438926 RepID=UPI003F89D77C
METTSGNLASALKLEPGITAIIGSGGKSTLLKTLGLELMRAGGRVLLCTTTHMFPVAGVPWDGTGRRLDAAPWKPGAAHVPGCTCEACAGLARGSICQAGVLDPETGKLSAPAEPLGKLAQRFNYVLAEANGSKRLPLKAHAAWEPVIPSGTANIVWIVGASGLGKPINEAVHRPELFCERCGCELTDTATPERVAQVLNAEMQALRLDAACVMLNQVDALSDSTMADRFEAALGRPVVATSLQG